MRIPKELSLQFLGTVVLTDSSGSDDSDQVSLKKLNGIQICSRSSCISNTSLQSRACQKHVNMQLSAYVEQEVTNY